MKTKDHEIIQIETDFGTANFTIATLKELLMIYDSKYTLEEFFKDNNVKKKNGSWYTDKTTGGEKPKDFFGVGEEARRAFKK